MGETMHGSVRCRDPCKQQAFAGPEGIRRETQARQGTKMVYVNKGLPRKSYYMKVHDPKGSVALANA